MLQTIRQRNLDISISICSLCTTNPDFEMDIYKVTPLVEACCLIDSHHNGLNVEQKWIKLIELLLQKGSNPNHYGQNRGTPLTAFILKASTYLSGVFAEKILKILLQYGANVNLYSYTLSYAVSGVHAHPELVRLLLQHNVCQTNKNGQQPNTGYTPLEKIKKEREAACYRNKPNLVAIQYMLENGWQKYDLQQNQWRLQEEERKKQELLRFEEERKKQELLHQEKERKKQELLHQEEERKKQELLHQEEEQKKQKLLHQEEEQKEQEELKNKNITTNLRISLEKERIEKYNLLMHLHKIMLEMRELANTVNQLQDRCDKYEATQ
jgi:hypothetical protein